MKESKLTPDKVAGASQSEPSSWQKIGKAVRSNLLPGAMLQMLALGILVSYYQVDAVRAFLNDVAEFKVCAGWIFAVVSTAIFAGVLPLILRDVTRKLTGQVAIRESAASWLCFVVFWGFIGFTIDVLYQFQVHLFGNNNEVRTVVSKVALDMLTYTPFFSIPLAVLVLTWKDNGFDFGVTRHVLGRRWFPERVFPLIVAAWVVWIPSTAIIYSLPFGLQLPVMNIIECFWGLIVLCTSVSATTDEATEAEGLAVMAEIVVEPPFVAEPVS